MEISNFIFLFYLTTLIGIITLFYVEKINAKTVFFISTMVYGLPLYFGYTISKTSNVNGETYYEEFILPEVYFIFIVCQIIYLLSLVNFVSFSKITTKKEINSQKKYINYKTLLYALNISLIISFITFILTTGIDTFSIELRREKIANYTVWYYFTSIISTITIILGILINNKNWKIYFLPILYLFFDLIMGDRTFLFLGFISFVISYFDKRRIKFNIKKRMKLGISLLVVLIIAFVYKPFYFAISLGYFKVTEIGEYINRALIGSEPFVIIANLNSIINFGGIKLNNSYFIDSILGYLPMYETLTSENRTSFNALFQSILFPKTTWGLGSTSFGEVFSIGGMVGVCIFLFFIFYFLILRIPQTLFLKILYYFIVPYILFYFHRTDFHYFIGMIRFYFYSFIIIIPVYFLLNMIKRSKKF